VDGLGSMQSIVYLSSQVATLFSQSFANKVSGFFAVIGELRIKRKKVYLRLSGVFVPYYVDERRGTFFAFFAFVGSGGRQPVRLLGMRGIGSVWG